MCGQVALCFQGQGTSLCLVKPHALAEGFAGPVLRALGEHFSITGVQSASLETADATDFFEVYRGVLPGGEVSAMIKELIAGELGRRKFPCLYWINLHACMCM